MGWKNGTSDKLRYQTSGRSSEKESVKRGTDRLDLSRVSCARSCRDGEEIQGTPGQFTLIGCNPSSREQRATSATQTDRNPYLRVKLMSHIFRCAVITIATALITTIEAPSCSTGRVLASMLGGMHSRVAEINRTGHSAEFCEVFEPCAEFAYSDSIIKLITRTARGRFPWEGEEYRLGATILAYLEFDDNLVVRRFELGTFLSADSSNRSEVESILLPVYRDYFAKHVVGNRIREAALSASGGRIGGITCDDGFARKDSFESAGNLIYKDRSGTLMLRIRTGRLGLLKSFTRNRTSKEKL